MQDTASEKRSRIAILVDAENISADNWPTIDTVFAGLGASVSLTCFGDFNNAAHAGWRDVCKTRGGTTVLVPRNGGKNAADIALTMEATELLDTHAAEMIVIVSSDSDFAPLAKKIIAAGCIAIGIGRDTASEGLRRAFNRYAVLPGRKRDPRPAPLELTSREIDQLAELVTRLARKESSGAVLLSRLGLVLRSENPKLAQKLVKGKLRKVLHRYGIAEEYGQGTTIRIRPKAPERKSA